MAGAAAGLTGYTVEFNPEDNHNLGRVQIQADTVTDASTVTVTATLRLLDWSGDWDDRYDGQIFVAVIEGYVMLWVAEPHREVGGHAAGSMPPAH